MNWLKDIVGFLNKTHGLSISESASGQEVAEAIESVKIVDYSAQINDLTARLSALESAKPESATLEVSEVDLANLAKQAATIAETSLSETLNAALSASLTSEVTSQITSLREAISGEFNVLKGGKDVKPAQDNLDMNKNKENKTEGSVTLKSTDIFGSKNEGKLFNGLI
jgi:hypothetical protein